MTPSSARQVYQALRPLIDDLYSKIAGIIGGGVALAGDVIAPDTNNRLVQMRGDPVTAIVNEVSGTTIKQTEGGTLVAPTQETQLFVQPRDPAKAGFVLRLDFGTFNGTLDNVWQWGYNPAGTDPNHGGTEPQAWMQVEQDFQPNPGGPHFTEWHINMFDAAQVNGCRPFFAGCDRASGAVTTQIGYAYPIGSPGGGAGIVLFSQSGATNNSMVEFIDTTGTGSCELAFNVSAFINSVGFAVLRSQTSSVFIDTSTSIIWRVSNPGPTWATWAPSGGGGASYSAPELVPVADNTTNLGTTANRWADVESVTSHTTILGSSSAATPFDFAAQTYNGAPLSGTQAVDKTRPRINITGTITSGTTYTLDFGNTATGFYIIDISRVTSTAAGAATLALKNGTDTVNVSIPNAIVATDDIVTVLLATNNIAVRS